MLSNRQKQFKVSQINCENLFLYMDLHQNQDVHRFNEKEWQGLSSSSTPNKPLYKVKWLAEALLEIDADVVLLNEVGGLESLANFNRHFLKDRYEPLLVEGNSDRGIDVGYLLRRNLPLRPLLLTHRKRPLGFLYPHEVETNQHCARLGRPPAFYGHYFSRDVAELRLFRQGEQQPALIFLLVHLKSKLDNDGIDPGGRLRRGAELKTLIEIYKQVRQEVPGTPVLVGGDFNGQARRQDPEPEFLPIYEESDLIDAFDLLNRPLEESATQVQFFRSRAPQLTQIDYLFLSPELQSSLQSAGTYVYRYKSDLKVTLPYANSQEQRNALPSDHYPIVASFTDLWTSS